MKLDWKTIGLATGLLLNAVTVAYWGGTTRERVDDTKTELTIFVAKSDAAHADFVNAINNLNVRVGITEALCGEPE
jgi:alcohol dehydrogenase class IV